MACLLETLKHRTVISDGAMGTQLFAAGLTPGACGEKWNVDNPDAVGAIHRGYAQAGCDCVTTNTFGGNALVLARHGLSDQVASLNRAAAQLARQAAGEHVWVLADLGPCGGFLEPLGDIPPEIALEAFMTQAQALRDGGADAAIIETMTDAAEVDLAVRGARACSDWPIIVTGAFDHGDGKTYRTMMGAAAGDMVRAAVAAGANVVGANCGAGMTLDDYRRLADQLLTVARGVPVIVQPNAGAPRMVDGHEVYDAQPDDMAALAAALVDAGVRMIGGCCGTTPAHLRAMARAAGKDA